MSAWNWHWLSYALLTVPLCIGCATLARGDDAISAPVLDIMPDNPGIGDPVMLRLSIEVAADLLVNFPRLGAKLGAFAVAGQRALEPDAEAVDRREWVQQYRLEPETTGDLMIPPLTVTVQNPKSLEAIEVATSETAVHVVSIVPAATDLREIKDILPPVSLQSMGSALRQWLPAIVVPILIAIALAFRWRRQRTPSEPVLVVGQAPDRAALDALRTLRSDTASDSAGIERFHIRLSAILRRYLQESMAIAAPLKTTEELLADAALIEGPPGSVVDLVGKPLGQCDLVKFARHRPSGDAMKDVLDDAVAFVVRTSRQSEGDSDDAGAA